MSRRAPGDCAHVAVDPEASAFVFPERHLGFAWGAARSIARPDRKEFVSVRQGSAATTIRRVIALGASYGIVVY